MSTSGRIHRDIYYDYPAGMGRRRQRGEGGRGQGVTREEDAPSREEEEQHADADEGADVATGDVAEAADEDAAANHDPGTDDCFRGD
jgi:hypothetical protein